MYVHGVVNPSLPSSSGQFSLLQEKLLTHAQALPIFPGNRESMFRLYGFACSGYFTRMESYDVTFGDQLPSRNGTFGICVRRSTRQNSITYICRTGPFFNRAVFRRLQQPFRRYSMDGARVDGTAASRGKRLFSVYTSSRQTLQVQGRPRLPLSWPLPHPPHACHAAALSDL